MMRQTTFLALLAGLLLLVAACGGEGVPPTYEYTGYLTEEIPPCTPVPGSPSDPCGTDVAQITGGGEATTILVGSEPRGVGYFFGIAAHVAHLVVRATYLPDTVRCALDEGGFRHPPYDDASDWSYSAGSYSIKCYADVRVNAYILGSGPPNLTLLVWKQILYGRYEEEDDYDVEGVNDLRHTLERVFIEGGGEYDYAYAPEGGIYGREAVLFVGPAVDAQTEAWQVFHTWGVEQRDDDTVVAVHPFRETYRVVLPDSYNTHRSKLEMELPAFRTAVAAAHQARLTANGGRTGPDPGYPMLQTDANRLTEFFTAIGAYNHPDGPPTPPPPACGLAMSDQQDKPGLMQDCTALLAAKDTLRGTGTLNWDTGTLISSWDGVTTEGTPARVTKVELDDEDLTGTIPADLGELSKLTHLDLSDNSLTGNIPRELGHLDNLEEIRLSGNTLTGCIPYGLKDVTTNDLSSLNLLYCPSAPGAPTAGTAAETSLALSWTAVANSSKYRVEYREGTVGPWTVDDDAITTTSHTVDGLLCETEYQFRLSAYGNGTTYAAAWSDPSESLTGTTGSCTPPVFGAASYSFSVRDDAAAGSVVGTVSATDNSTGPVVYDIKSWTVNYIVETDLFALTRRPGRSQ